MAPDAPSGKSLFASPRLDAVWSALMTLTTVLVGSLVDAIGLRKAFLLGAGICLVARGVMTFSDLRWLALAGGLLPLAVGEALLTPVMVAAVRRYSTTPQRSIAFSIFYAMMNVGFFIGNLIFDFVRQNVGEYGHFNVPFLGIQLTAYRTLFLISFLLTIPNLALFYFFLREGVEAIDEGVKLTPARREEGSAATAGLPSSYRCRANFRRLMAAARVLQIPSIFISGGCRSAHFLPHALYISEVRHS